MNKHEKHEKHGGGSGFLLGLVVGFLLATLLTTKKGRQILKELIDSGLEIFEEFAEDRRQDKNFTKSIEVVKQKAAVTPIEEVEDAESVAQDIDSEVAAVDVPEEIVEDVSEQVEEEVKKPETSREKEVEAPKFKKDEEGTPKEEKAKSHAKKRLFRGIRKK